MPSDKYIQIKQVSWLIRESKKALSLDDAIMHLKKAQRLLNKIIKINRSYRCDLLQAKIYVEFALNSNVPSERRQNWKKATLLLKSSFFKYYLPILAIDHANIVIDSAQDIYSNIYDSIILKHIANAKKIINMALSKRDKLIFSDYSSLLSRLSSLLRLQSLYVDSNVHKILTLKKALRTSQKAIELNEKDSWGLLELGNCYWALARYQDTDEKYNNYLSKAESCFKESSIHSNEVAAIGLAKFYRLTYQASKACDTFLAVSTFASDKRRLLRESYILAEATQNLWYSKYPPSYTSSMMKESIRFLELAINAGYNHSRIIIDLCILYAMSGEIENSKNILSSELILDESHFDWNKVVDIILSNKSVDSLASRGFALGLTSENSLNKLGTYAKDFLNDPEMALVFYRTAQRISRNNPIVLNNIAGLLIELNDESYYQEIHRLLDKAKIFADRRFTWWQINLNKLYKIKGKKYKPKARNLLKSKGATYSFYDRRLEYYKIEEIEDPHERGREFERYINDLISISFTESLGSHVAPGIQIDGFFIHRGFPFRVEVKWRKPALEAKYIREFLGRLQLASLHGVFISMSGFTDNAIDHAKRMMTRKCILLINKTDILKVVEGELSFNVLIDLKYYNFYTKERII